MKVMTFLEENKYELSNTVLSNNKEEMGQVGINSRLIDDIRAEYVTDNDLTIREMMTLLQNVIKDPNKKKTCDAFINVLVDVESTPEYMDALWVDTIRDYVSDSVGWPFKTWYAQMRVDEKAYEGFPNACSLWNPITLLYPIHVLGNPHCKWDGNLRSHVTAASTTPTAECEYVESELSEELSSREREFLGKHIKDEKLPWKPGRCYYTVNEDSVTSKLRERFKIATVANTSGHTFLMITLSKYFKNVDRVSVILACIVWMVPHDHSMHEILMAAKLAKIEPFVRYNPTQTNVISFLNEITSTASDSLSVIGGQNQTGGASKRVSTILSALALLTVSATASLLPY